MAGLRGAAIDAFVTEELREHEQRVGFWLSPADGRQVLLAHRRMDSPLRVGPYKVNRAVLEETAVDVIRRAAQRSLVLFIDELGRMELASTAFQDAVRDAFDRGPRIVATAGLAHLPFLTALKRRRDVELIPLSPANRAVVEEELLARLRALCDEDESARALQRQADRICEMIVSGEAGQIDIDIQQAALREAVAKAFPDKHALYQLIYESRFRRLWQQFRHH
jgi:nucleoside-triphosphatase